MHLQGGSEELFEAIGQGKTQRVHDLLANNCDPNSRRNDEHCTTALIYAVQRKKLKSVKLLLSSNANPDNRDKLGMTACMYAADKGLLDFICALTEFKADINATDNDGATTLMLTAQWGHCDCLQFLINESVNINAQDKRGCTALMYAAKHDRHECVRRLVDAKADVNIVDDKGYTALMHAIKHGNYPSAWILVNRTDVNIVSKDGDATALAIAFQDNLKGDFSFIAELLRLGADVSKSGQSRNYLHEMIARGEKEIVRLMLINHCPPTDVVCTKHCFKFTHATEPISPIAVALLSGYPEIARYLIANRFYTQYDLTQFPNDKILEVGGDSASVKELLAYLCEALHTLKTLSLGTVSDRLSSPQDGGGFHLSRSQRVDALDVPSDLKSDLLFEHTAKICLLYWHDLPIAEMQRLKLKPCACPSCRTSGGGTMPEEQREKVFQEDIACSFRSGVI